MQAVQTNAKITGLLDPEYAKERAFYSHISKVPESVRHPAVLVLLILCSRLPLLALELPGVHPSEPCHGAAGVGGHGSYHPVGQRMKEVEAVERMQNQKQHSVLSQEQCSVLVHTDVLWDLCFLDALNFTGDILISAEHNIHIIPSFFTGIIFFQKMVALKNSQLRKPTAMKNLPVFEGSGTI